MDITYKNKKLERICTEAKFAERTYGKERESDRNRTHYGDCGLSLG